MASNTSMLDLPRELYLMVCSYLTTTELTKLSSVSRDHYLAVQQPLFSHVNLTTYGALVKLVRTLMKVPIVSQITSKQRLHWRRLSEDQLRERNIKQLELVLDNYDQQCRITAADLSSCIGAISRKCPKIRISLTLQGLWLNFDKQLDSLALPNVTSLSFFVGELRQAVADRHYLKKKIWDVAFAGSAFPDLRKVYMNTLTDVPANVPSYLDQGIELAENNVSRSRYSSETSANCDPFYGLTNMEEIILELNTFLRPEILQSLFASSIIPKRLTSLEIIHCPKLDQIRDLEALATLLQRGLQLLQFLRLHLVHRYDRDWEDYESHYCSKINQNHEHHLCNIVRELGQNIKGLELAVPFACNRIFVPPPQKARMMPREALPLPSVPEYPLYARRQRLMEAGYRYRRLIFHRYCRDAHKWEDMAALAEGQSEDVSWDVWCEGDQKAVWFVTACRPVEMTLDDAMQSSLYHE